MYKLIRSNIEREVESKIECDRLVSEGYVLLVEEVEEKKKKVSKKLG